MMNKFERTLYSIISELQSTQGTNAKLQIMLYHKDNKLFRDYMKAVYSPAINYYIKKLPKSFSLDGEMDFYIDTLEQLKDLSERVVTGNAAQEHLASILSGLNGEGRDLVELLIKRSIGAGVGDTMVLTTWPELFFVPYYQRCSLLDDKAVERFSKMDTFYVQTKLDGSFAYLQMPLQGDCQLITRNGNIYPTWIAEQIGQGLMAGLTYVGELEVYSLNSSVPLERKEGNGILNSIMQGSSAHNFKDFQVKFTAWDCLENVDFKRGRSDVEYHKRFGWLKNVLEYIPKNNFSIVDSTEVETLEQAYEIYTQCLKEGLEGCVIKDLESIWKDGTSKQNVKLKLKFQADYIITGKYEGTGKYKGMLGGYSIASLDGKIQCNVGSGFSDAQRVDGWENDYIGNIVTVEANEIQTNRSDSIRSLFLPIFIEIRYDKSVADSYEHVVAQLEAAKRGR